MNERAPTTKARQALAHAASLRKTICEYLSIPSVFGLCVPRKCSGVIDGTSTHPIEIEIA